MKALKETLIRTGMTFLFLPVLYFVLTYNACNSLAFAVFVSVVGLGALLEFRFMARQKGYILPLWLLIPLTLALHFLFFSGEIFSAENPLFRLRGILGILMLSVLVSSALQLFKPDFEKAFNQLALTLFALIYTGLMWGTLISIKQLEQGMLHLIVLISTTWFCDIGAYFTGKLMGKHKLNLPVSPNKTLEGFIGGIVFSVGASVLAFKLTGLAFAYWILIIPLATIVGDLLESVMKRAFGVKDSSRIIPGHGGILDVFDSLIFTAPIYYFCLQILG